MKIITSSSLSAFRRCPRRYFMNYILRRVPATEPQTIRFGKAMHTALEHWWSGGIEAAVEALNKIALDISPEDTARLCALLAHYNPPRERFEVLGVEQPFEIKIQNPAGTKRSRPFYGYRLAGKVDLVLREVDTGLIYVADHKTTASEILGFGPYWQSLQVDSQMSNYSLAFNADGFIYDVIKKPGIKLCGKDEKAAEEKGITPEEAYEERCEAQIAAEPEAFFQWREFVKLDEDMAAARQDLWDAATLLRQCDKAGRYPRFSDSCTGMYGSCPYLEVCAGGADIGDDRFFRDKTDEHEELAA